MVKTGIGRFVGVELIDDIDGLRRHAESPREIVVGGNLVGTHAGAGDEIVELDAQQDLAVIAQFRGELDGHRP